MAMTVKEIKDWLEYFSDEDLLGIDEGGTILQAVEDYHLYLEIGGIPEGVE